MTPIDTSNTISNNNNSQTTSVSGLTPNGGAVTDFSSVLADTASDKSSPHVTTSSVSLLTTPEASLAARPNMKQFMDATGASFEDASEFIYGVIGSNTDSRDWGAIMSSKDPIASVRQATNALYNSSSSLPNPLGTYMGPTDTVDKSGNFGVRLAMEPVSSTDPTKKIVDSGLKLIDSQGLILRDAGETADQIARNAWLFGFDMTSLNSLASASGTISSSLEDAVKAAPSFALPSTTSLVPQSTVSGKVNTNTSPTSMMTKQPQSMITNSSPSSETAPNNITGTSLGSSTQSAPASNVQSQTTIANQSVTSAIDVATLVTRNVVSQAVNTLDRLLSI